MAYVSTNDSTATTAATVREMGGGSLYSDLAAGANPRAGGLMYRYCSSHAAADIVGTGFFKGCGGQPLSSTGTPHPNVVARSQNNVGMRVGDVLLNIESSGGATPGKATWHGVSASTFGGSTATYASTVGYDVTVIA